MRAQLPSCSWKPAHVNAHANTLVPRQSRLCNSKTIYCPKTVLVQTLAGFSSSLCLWKLCQTWPKQWEHGQVKQQQRWASVTPKHSPQAKEGQWAQAEQKLPLGGWGFFAKTELLIFQEGGKLKQVLSRASKYPLFSRSEAKMQHIFWHTQLMFFPSLYPMRYVRYTKPFQEQQHILQCLHMQMLVLTVPFSSLTIQTGKQMLPFPRTLKSLLHYVCSFGSCSFRLDSHTHHWHCYSDTCTRCHRVTWSHSSAGETCSSPQKLFPSKLGGNQNLKLRWGTMKEEALPLQNRVLGVSFHHVDLNGKKAEVTSHSPRECLIGKKLKKKQER